MPTQIMITLNSECDWDEQRDFGTLKMGGNQTLAANCTKVSFAESRLSSPDTSYSGNLLQLSDRETP